MKFYIKSPIALILLLSLFSLSALAENEKSEIFDFIQSQFKNQSDNSLGPNSSSTDSDFVIEIGTVYDVEPGSFVDVPVTIYSPPWKMSGIELRIKYNPSVFSLNDVIEGVDFFDRDSGCGWEYFAWRHGPADYCAGVACPTGTIRVLGIADIGIPWGPPNCFNPGSPAHFISFRFLVTNDYNERCNLFPLKFIWYECGENAIWYSSPEDSTGFERLTAYGSQVYSDDSLINISDSFPSYGGMPESCFENPHFETFRDKIIFHNGGISIQCDDTEPLIGDINLDGAWNIIDLGLFVDYFRFGESAFEIYPSEQIAATDINKDGESLKLEDLVQLSNMIFDALDPDSTIDSTLDGGMVNNDKTSKTVSLHTHSVVDAIWIKMSGNIVPYHPTNGSLLGHFYDGSHTRILFWSYIEYGPGNFELFDYTGEGEIVEAQAATNVGVEIALRIDDVVTSIEEPDDILPSVFSLHQNYPNPFNIETVIEFDLPRASQVSFEIINILGQIVYDVTSRHSAGSHTIFWDGSSNSGQIVGSGVYYYRISAGNFGSSKKMMLLK